MKNLTGVCELSLALLFVSLSSPAVCEPSQVPELCVYKSAGEELVNKVHKDQMTGSSPLKFFCCILYIM